MDTEKIELFEKYLAGDMSAEERTAFESDLSADRELAEDFSLYQYIETDRRASYAAMERERVLKESIKGLNEEFFPERPVVIGRDRNLRYMISGVAATLLLGGVLLFLLLSHSVDIQEEVSSYYATNFEVLGQTMGMESDLQVAIEAYNKKEYTQAVHLFESLLEQDSQNSELLKNMGLSYLAINDFQSALEVFDRLANVPGLHVNEGMFLYAMTLLLRGDDVDLEEAEKMLNTVVREGKSGSVQAAQWLEKLGR
ncbi:hypothetical protein ADIS_3564 [Lunatimonas lonarensis]|uniref:Uncharacterized protein n=1 Tax=Lunatimonas lonarensis TaxID=1232681 RepID=R7ZPD2_9BACT|nr:tetratricopeptide repeat protein [Lunatimonas lonarensis]EON75976.1 hypothetical protein ADIS_3564 [Lunatimonas lonarensis]